MSNIVIVGASRGLGHSLSKALIGKNDRAWLISKNRPPTTDDEHVRWITCDLSKPGIGISAACAQICPEKIDLLIYNASIWERASFSKTPANDLVDILNVSLVSAVQIVRELDSLIRRGQGHLILIGSTSGLDNEGAKGVAYASAKFGLRGVAHSLRENYRSHGVRVTCLNPGSMATDLEYGQEQIAKERYGEKRIPVEDVVKVIKCILSLSTAACVKELVLPSLLDEDV